MKKPRKRPPYRRPSLSGASTRQPRPEPNASSFDWSPGEPVYGPPRMMPATSTERKIVTMRKALADPRYFGLLLAGNSWAAWRVLLIAIVGEDLTEAERVHLQSAHRAR